MTGEGGLVRRVLVGLAAAASLTVGAGTAAAQAPEPNFAVDVAPRPCALDSKDAYEARFYEEEGWGAPDYERYPGACRRMRFSYGPIPVKPGQNDVLIGPVTIEKPLRDGFITRFRPNLVRADGTVPPVEQVHLHHGTWLSVPAYGSGPFFAAGEEKTIAPWPKGYGMPIKASDTWLLLYMVHSAVAEPMETYITYDIDFVPEAEGEALGLKPAYPVWLDVRPSGYPVFNVQRKYGGADGVCTWPTEQCADFDPYGETFVGQGAPGNGKGQDFELPKLGEPLGAIESFKGGTLIGIGGHLHPGGIQNEIDLVRPGGEDVRIRKRLPLPRRKVCVKRRAGRCVKSRTKVVKKRKVCVKRRAGKCVKRRMRKVKRRYRTVVERRERTRIYTGRAHYWDRDDPSKAGGPPTSWDFSMEVQGLPRWGIHLKPGDILRSNATYDTTFAATYENMGIAVALLAPFDDEGRPTAEGVNPFQAVRDHSDGCRSGGATNGVLCTKGIVTHGHYPENGNHGGPGGTWDARRGQPTNEVAIANFLYEPGDLSTIGTTGVPTVKLGSELRFTNLEGAAIYHTITTCAFPCLGQTGAAFPLPDGRTSLGRPLDLDSSEVGFGAPEIGPAAQRLDWRIEVTRENGFQPGETVTYFCRIHPFMRGAFEVVE